MLFQLFAVVQPLCCAILHWLFKLRTTYLCAFIYIYIYIYIYWASEYSSREYFGFNSVISPQLVTWLCCGATIAWWSSGCTRIAPAPAHAYYIADWPTALWPPTAIECTMPETALLGRRRLEDRRRVAVESIRPCQLKASWLIKAPLTAVISCPHSSSVTFVRL